MTRRKTFLLQCLLLHVSVVLCQPVFAPVELSVVPPCLHAEGGRDTLQFPAGRERFVPFFDKLSRLMQGADEQLNILHIGGSHVQAGDFTHRMRTNLASLGRNGGRGLLFPFSALRTNTPASYTIGCEGVWDGVRCVKRDTLVPLGLSGACVTTRDTLARLVLPLVDLRAWPASQLRVLGQADTPQIRPILLCGTDTLQPLPADSCAGFRFCLPESADTCVLSFSGIVQDSLGFSVRGFLPEGAAPGITYTASGINGASVPAWLRCSLFAEELSLLPPDLVILGLGINDANVWPQKFDVAQFKENYRQLIRRIRDVSPQCCFVFITNNDCWFNFRGRRRQYNTNTPRVEQAMKELAAEEGAAVFDVFALMGGLRSSNAWVRAKLLRPDHIHFTREGYYLLGDLLYNALARAAQQQLGSPVAAADNPNP